MPTAPPPTETLDDGERRRLGLDEGITRRDFVNGALASTGGAMFGTSWPGISSAAPDPFTGFGGVGDYRNANGNTGPVVRAAHRLRDGRYNAASFAAAKPAGDYDLIVVGGGIAGLSAAYYFLKATGSGKRVLVLENHPMLGGEARQNEFEVGGERLLAPQGSNDFAVPARGTGSLADEFFEEFELPREYRWQSWDAALRPLRFARDNYSNMDGYQESQVDIGYHFDRSSGAAEPVWRRNIWENALRETPFSEAARRDLKRWRGNSGPLTEAEERHLDTLTYQDYLEKLCKFDPAVTRFVEPVVGLLSGVSADAASARLGRQLVEPSDRPLSLSFPGGNSVFPRALLRGLNPDALPGRDFDSLLYGAVSCSALDREGYQTRLRMGATVLRVAHRGGDVGARELDLYYESGGTVFRAGGRAVVTAIGGWINKHILADMPPDLRAAYDQFAYAPALIVNVALRQWRFLYDLGVTACRWFDEDGLGYCCNLRQTMVSDRHAAALHPDHPAILTFYMGFPIRGLPAPQQGVVSRTRLFSTPYLDFEVQVRRQMLRLFGAHGFEPKRDIAAIILNRWGHARLIEPPGFHYGIAGRPSPLERVRQGYGRVSIGHSELNGAQHWHSALEYGKRAGERAATLV